MMGLDDTSNHNLFGDNSDEIGQNELDFNFNVNSGVLFLNIRNEQVNYGTSKIIFR